jgi:predicted membrane channel-forming protein YqfA (hemolysin III family)
MMNRYLKRGLMLFLAGLALIAFGYYLKDTELFKYGWAMVIGYVAFGCGVLYIIYSLMRKIERRGILKERAVEAEEEENNSREA